MLRIVWILMLFTFHHVTTSGYIENVIISGCESCRLMLTCRHLNAVIAILDFDYRQIDAISLKNTTNLEKRDLLSLREALNQRCSGVNHCSFILTEDCPGGKYWPTGNLTIKYSCVTEDKIQKYCNSNIVLPGQNNVKGISHGFIHNPGYPRFYSGLLKCQWKITAPSQQKIEIVILDLSIIVDNVVGSKDCTDVVEIKDSNGQVIQSTCRQENPPYSVLSSDETLEILLISKQNFNPRRGILIYYTAVGCSTPTAPEDGYLVYRNDTVAEYSCCVGFLFPDTRMRVKILKCLGSIWDTPLPLLNCKKIKQLTTQIIKTKETKMDSDIITPAILMAALFVINAGIVFFIHREKKKQHDAIREEELRTL